MVRSLSQGDRCQPPRIVALKQPSALPVAVCIVLVADYHPGGRADHGHGFQFIMLAGKRPYGTCNTFVNINYDFLLRSFCRAKINDHLHPIYVRMYLRTYSVVATVRDHRRQDDMSVSARNPCCCIQAYSCLLYTSPSPRDRSLSRMPSSA